MVHLKICVFPQCKLYSFKYICWVVSAKVWDGRVCSLEACLALKRRRSKPQWLIVTSTVDLIFSLSILEAGTSLWVWGQPGPYNIVVGHLKIHCKTMSQNKQRQLDRMSTHRDKESTFTKEIKEEVLVPLHLASGKIPVEASKRKLQVSRRWGGFNRTQKGVVINL